uniref:Uncharacterized protein n=1 Tax=Triticum urartu TaxID=4572 RepID=A0A8R7U3Q6_TRIUA
MTTYSAYLPIYAYFTPSFLSLDLTLKLSKVMIFSISLPLGGAHHICS